METLFGSMALYSTAVFADRVSQCQLGAHQATFETLGWNTLGAFAFAANWQPGNPNERPFLEEIMIPLLGDENHPLKASVRMLHFEAFTVMAEEMKRKASRADEDDKPRKLPQAELAFRLRKIQVELVGLTIKGDLEPSDTLVNRFAAMQEEGVLKYLPWQKYGRKDVEQRNGVQEDYWKKDSSGALKEHTRTLESPTDITSDLKLRAALQRRGVALQMAKLLSYNSHEKWVIKLFKEYAKDPLPGRAKVSLDQIALADQELFIEMAELTRAGLRLTPEGKLPLEGPLIAAMAEENVKSLLVQLPMAVGAPRPEKRGLEANRPGNDHKRARPNQTEDGFYKKGGNSNGSQKGGAGKGKPQKKKGSVKMPYALIGMESSYKGKNICFAYNLPGGCTRKVNDMGSCEMGVHVCMRKGCGGNHSQEYTGCPAK